MKQSVKEYLEEKKLRSQLKANVLKTKQVGTARFTRIIDGEVVQDVSAQIIELTPNIDDAMRDEDGCPME